MAQYKGDVQIKVNTKKELVLKKATSSVGNYNAANVEACLAKLVATSKSRGLTINEYTVFTPKDVKAADKAKLVPVLLAHKKYGTPYIGMLPPQEAGAGKKGLEIIE